MAAGKQDTTSVDAMRPETMLLRLRGLLAAAVRIDVEGEIDPARTVAELLKLTSVEMSSQRTGDVAKASLPQHSVVEQSLHENHRGALPDLLRNRWGGAAAKILRP